jgi:hypothetical protein
MADQGYVPGPDAEAWPLMTLGCIGLPSGIPEGACSGKHSPDGTLDGSDVVCLGDFGWLSGARL